MKGETKLFLGIILFTVAIVVGAIFFFNQSSASGTKVDASLLVRPDSDKISSGSGAVTLVEFSDYQCPACGAYYRIVKQLISEFKDSMTFVYRNYPLPQHPNARLAAQAAEAAGRQNKFWEMHDILFTKQSDWSSAANVKDVFIQYAGTLQLNTDQFTKDTDASDIKAKIDEDVNDGNAVGINATPTFFLNGEKLENPASIDDFRTLIKTALLKNPVSQKPNQEYHIHADFKVYLANKAFDFSPAKYQSTDKKELSPDVHLHDGRGSLVHIHKLGVTLGEFFTSLGMSFTKDCFTDDTKNKFCNNSANTVKLFVNGKPNMEFDAYVPKDQDRILISYGNENDQALKQQIDSIPDDACIYSEKCPERGTPPTEECVGGLGTGCTKK